MKLFKVDHIQIRVHWSWFIIFALLWFSLSTAYFPSFFPGSSQPTYIFMGAVSALLLFISVILHELSHSFVAKKKGINVKEITLFFFGGVANISTEKVSAKTEFMMALAGPILSIYLASIFFVTSLFFHDLIILPILSYLASVNFFLGLFNLLPAYPLDGGRVFRSIIHSRTKNLLKSTRIAVILSRIISSIMIFIGLYGIFSGFDFFWFLLLGLFLYYLAGMAYDQTVISSALERVKVLSLMQKDYPKTSSKQNPKELLKKTFKDSIFFVVEDKKYIGIADLNLINKNSKMIQLITCKAELSPSDSALKAYELLAQNNVPFLPVIEKNKIKGIVTLRAIVNFTKLKNLE